MPPIGRGDQRLRTHSLNMGHLDMLKRNMIINGMTSIDSGNPALTSTSSLCRSDSGFNVVADNSLPTLDELSLDLPRIDESGTQLNLFNEGKPY